MHGEWLGAASRREHLAAFTPSGQPAISYYDYTNGDLKFAIRKPFVSP